MTNRNRWMARAAKALAEASGHLPSDLGLEPGHNQDAEHTAILALIDSGEIQ